MIDEKRLASVEQMLELHPNGTHAIFTNRATAPEAAWTLDGDFLRDILRLARLGLWAEKHQSAITGALRMTISEKWDVDRAHQALAALPKGAE
jgi:hypothetical protein